MSEIHSTQSSDTIKQVDLNNINSAPDLNKQPDNANEKTHGYFIPVVMMIVLGVIIVATFYSNEFNSLIASIASPDRDEDHIEVKQKPLARTVTSDESEDTAESSVITEAAVADKASNEDVTNTTEAAVSDSILTTSNPSSIEPAKESTSSAEFRIATAQDKPVYDTDKNNRGIPSYPSPVPYDRSEHYQQYYNEIMEHRRRAREHAMQARKEHMRKMHEYRTVVRKRIKQDRLDRYKQKHEVMQKSQRRLDELMDRREQKMKRSMNRPI